MAMVCGLLAFFYFRSFKDFDLPLDNDDNEYKYCFLLGEAKTWKSSWKMGLNYSQFEVDADKREASGGDGSKL